MGEVYRATDTKLKRDVALKVLPESFTQDPQRMARFTREAQVLASLNHPNIGAIHGLEEQDGVRALVLELIEGEDLSERIAKGPIALEEALQIALQIAEALEAAHEKGIIHRDLKPANVKITPEGQVKVLDFGLAKAMEEAPASSPEMTHSPTLTMQATQAGMILGTAAYMSPEQARGKPVDGRSDIWALGVVIFEMLAGQRPFDGETISDIMAAILTQAPDLTPIEKSGGGRLGYLVQRCLSRDPRRRVQDVGDARVELSDILSDPNVGNVEGAAKTAAHSSWTPWLVAAGSLLLALFLSIRSQLDSGPTPTMQHLAIGLPLGQQLVVGTDFEALALSPDGETIAFATNRLSPGTGIPSRLYVRRLDEPQPRLVEASEGALSPFFSPDGEWVGFNASGELRIVPVNGGSATTVCDWPDARCLAPGWDNPVYPDNFLRNLPCPSAGRGDPRTVDQPGCLEGRAGARLAQNHSGRPFCALYNLARRQHRHQ